MFAGIFAKQPFFMLKGKLFNDIKSITVILIIVVVIIIPVAHGGGNFI